MPRITPAGACRGAVAVALLWATAVAAQETPYAATSRGARCALQKDATLSCRYVVGQDLEFSLHRVTEPNLRLEVVRNDPAGDYRIEPELLGRCVLVRFGERDAAKPGAGYVSAAVSGKNGMVYHTLRECRLAR